jgi:hypothetical protein
LDPGAHILIPEPVKNILEYRARYHLLGEPLLLFFVCSQYAFLVIGFPLFFA